MWESESESVGERDYSNGVLSSSKHVLKTDGFERRDQSWYVASEIPSDLLVQVEEFRFHLHKYPLLSRSGRMNRIIYESRDGPELSRIEMNDVPGGPEAFELVAKFCYGIAVDLTAANISGLRCAAEYLEMTEDLEEGNLIFKTEAFLSYVVLSSWRDSILVLKSCEQLSPWAENLQIVRRCSESIAWKACANPKGIRWAYTGKTSKISSPKWNEMKESSPGRNQQVPADWWFEDVSILRIDHFVRVSTAIKVKGMRFELIGAAIMHYASKWLPGLAKEDESNINNKDNGWKGGGLQMVVAGNKEELPIVQMREQRMIIESLISIIPPQKDCVSCSFLLRLLRMANRLKVAPALVTELEKRVGMQFQQANLADLLIPSYNKNETLYDVDLVQRLLEHFLVQEQTEPLSPGRQAFSEKRGYEAGTPSSHPNSPNAKMRVARLVDSYLTEVARDRNLSLTKFQVLAEALPDSARTCDDGLYRAVDSYLKAHPTLSEHERKRLCRVMDCQKLSIDACMHAAQNERLPLRIVVQVLFSEQVKISNAIANNSLKEPGECQHQLMISTRKALLEGTPQSFQEGWAMAKKDINTLKFELESTKAKYLELQTDMENLQKQFEKLSKQKQSSSAWSSGWKKLTKLTKMTGPETQEIGPQIPSAAADQTRKTTRRWRNSIS